MFFLLDNMGRSEEGLIFKPKYLGDFSQNYKGTVKNLIDEGGVGRRPDYQLMYLDGKIPPQLSEARLHHDPTRMPESVNVVHDLQEVLREKKEINKKKHEEERAILRQKKKEEEYKKIEKMH